MTVGSEQPAHKKRSGRRIGPTSSHELILEAAQAKFSEHGFEGTTMRAVAAAANVDSALIHHFFLSKEGLFMAATQEAFTVPELVPLVTTGEPGQAGHRLALAFLTHWDKPEIRPRVESIVRSVRSFEGASTLLSEFLGEEVLRPVTAALGHGRTELRASLVGTHVLGIAYMRFVLRAEPLASMSAEQVAVLIGDACQSYLTERL